jgi:hypothetical protein
MTVGDADGHETLAELARDPFCQVVALAKARSEESSVTGDRRRAGGLLGCHARFIRAG